MTQFEKSMLEIQEELLIVQKIRNEILRDAFVVRGNAIPALEKLVMEIVTIQDILRDIE